MRFVEQHKSLWWSFNWIVPLSQLSLLEEKWPVWNNISTEENDRLLLPQASSRERCHKDFTDTDIVVMILLIPLSINWCKKLWKDMKGLNSDFIITFLYEIWWHELFSVFHVYCI